MLVKVAAKNPKDAPLAHIQDAIELKCDTCGAWLGFVFEKNLSGSYFYCSDCVFEHTQKLPAGAG